MITFFTDLTLQSGVEIDLGEPAVAHARARRIAAGEPARLLDGRGTVGTGAVVSIEKRHLRVRVDATRSEPRPPVLEVLAPVADKDRMLWAAEKCAELQVTAWRPTVYARSRSVNPRGEGPRFREKVEARMRAAVEQSGGAWLPEIADEQDFPAAIRSVGAGTTRLLLDSSGTSMAAHISRRAIALAVGPEGGFEADELRLATDAGWQTVALSSSVLRFETAVVAGVAVARAVQMEEKI